MKKNPESIGLGDIGARGHGEGGQGPDLTDIKEQLKRLTEREGGADKALERVVRENYKLRSERNTLREKIKAVPAEGAVILTAEQGKAWEEYQKLGKPEELVERVKSQGDAAKELATLKREKQVAEAAELLKLKPSAVLKLVGETPVELKDEQKDGKTQKVALVRDGDKTVGLEQWITDKWGEEFLQSARGETPKPPGTQWIPQNNGGKAAKGNDLVAQVKAKNKAAAEAPNPLMPAAPATK